MSWLDKPSQKARENKTRSERERDRRIQLWLVPLAQLKTMIEEATK
jgi:hypothetical protein